MRYSIATILAAATVAACNAQEEKKMSGKELTLTIECKVSSECLNINEGQKQIPIAVRIENTSDEPVEFPVEAFETLFLYAKYENPKSGLEYTVPGPPQELSGNYTGAKIAPKKSVTIDDVIYPEYIEMVADKKDHTPQRIIAKYTIPTIKGWEIFGGLTASQEIAYRKK